MQITTIFRIVMNSQISYGEIPSIKSHFANFHLSSQITPDTHACHLIYRGHQPRGDKDAFFIFSERWEAGLKRGRHRVSEDWAPRQWRSGGGKLVAGMAWNRERGTMLPSPWIPRQLKPGKGQEERKEGEEGRKEGKGRKEKKKDRRKGGKKRKKK